MSGAIRHKIGDWAVEKVPGAARQYKFKISDGTVDRDNDTINAGGWELTNYKRNPVVLFAHDSRSLPIGKAVSVQVEGDALFAVCEFATHAFAEEVYQLVKGGFMRATSVGFRTLTSAYNAARGGTDFLTQELLEFSVVPVPANANALVAAAGSGVGIEQVRAWAMKVLARAETKSGRAISAANAEILRSASDHCAAVMTRAGACNDEITKLLAQVMPDDPADADPSQASYLEVLDDEIEGFDDACVREAQQIAVRRSMNPAYLSDMSQPTFDVDPSQFRSAIGEVVGAALERTVRTAVERAVNQMRGRVD